MSGNSEAGLPIFILFTDDSEDSRLAREALDESGLPYREYNETRDRVDAEGDAPYLVTPAGPFVGFESIAALSRSSYSDLFSASNGTASRRLKAANP